jgi:Asp-tRNA(Asn)/Glu-tRNA(Gln) amidotransferase A subunit family amidase
VNAAVQKLRAAGWKVYDLPAPEGFERLTRAAMLINDYEGARSQQERWRVFGDRIGRKLAELVARGLAVPEEDYREALAAVGDMKRVAAALFGEYRLLLAPAATGPPPEGLESTGDPSANAPWTALGVPAIAVPLAVDGPPLGLQAAAAQGEDDSLVASAEAIASIIGPAACESPPS